MSDPRELELKLEVRPGKAAALRSKNLRRLGLGEGVRERLASVYFDTRKHALRKKGLTLRIRSAGDRHIQTIKSGGGSGAGLFDRPEWETDVDGGTPDLAAAAGTPVRDVLSGKPGDELKPVFATEVERTTWLVERGGSAIEMALDEGRIAAGGADRAIAELELELKRGSAGDLFGLVRALGGADALKIGVLTKSEQGYRLATGEAPACYKAEPVDLRPGMTAAEAFTAIVRSCIRHFRLNEPIVIDSRSSEALHQARVALRRLRSALSLFKDVATDGEGERIRRRLRAVAAQLGEARNLDVYLKRAGADHGEASAEALRADRELAYDKVLATFGSKRFGALMLDLLTWAESGDWRSADAGPSRTRRDIPIEDFAAALLDKRRRRVRKRGRDLEKLSPAKRHEVRIAAKKLRYASEFVASLVTGRKARRRHKDFLSALEALQDCLGDLNDIETGRDMAARMGPGDAATSEDRSEEREAELIAAATVAHRRFAEAKPFWKSFA